MIPPQFIQVSESNGTFDNNKSPAAWYKNMYGITTVWSLVYNGDGITLRTEGGLSNDRRNNGIQEDAGRNITGGFAHHTGYGLTAWGVFVWGRRTQEGNFNQGNTTEFGETHIELGRAYTTANEFRMRNRLMRIYILESIEGIRI